MKKAFSLIELSIVILIIGILIAGVTQGSRLLAQAKLKTAQTITKSSPVSSITNLVAWYESTLETSFDDEESENGHTITNWYDINPQSGQKYHMTSVGTKATYVANGMNGLPILRLTGGNASGYVNDEIPLGGQVTTFAVVNVASAPSDLRRLLQSADDQYLFFGINASAEFSAFYGSGSWNHADSFGSDAALELNKNYILAATLNSAGLNKGYVNGVDVGTPPTTPESKGDSTGLAISAAAGYTGQPWLGDVAEIIIFDRALRNEERQAVEAYLSKKWGIKI